MIVDCHAHYGRWGSSEMDLPVKSIEKQVEEMDKFGIDASCATSTFSLHYDFTIGDLELKEAVDKFSDRCT